MGLFDFIKNLLPFGQDWEVSAKYEFYRNYLKEYQISIDDYDFIRTLESNIEELEKHKTALMYENTHSADLLSLSDSLKFSKNHRKTLKEQKKNCNKIIKDLEKRDIDDLVNGRVEIPDYLSNYVRSMNESTLLLENANKLYLPAMEEVAVTKVSEDDIVDCYQLFVRRRAKIDILLNNYNKRKLFDEFYFTKNDIEFILHQFDLAPVTMRMKTFLVVLHSQITNPRETRVIIATVIYLLEYHMLGSNQETKVKEFFTRKVRVLLRRFLYSIIEEEIK